MRNCSRICGLLDKLAGTLSRALGRALSLEAFFLKKEEKDI